MGVESIRDPGPGKLEPSAKVQSKKPTVVLDADSAGYKATKSAARVPPQHSLCALKKCGPKGSRGRAGGATLTKAWKGHDLATHEQFNTTDNEQRMVLSCNGRHHRSVLGSRKVEACASRAHAGPSI